jgi:ribosomal protein L11 methyltransferase
MPWKELHITTAADKADAISDQLSDFGANAVTFRDGGDDPIIEPSASTPRIWAKTIVIGLFDSETDISPLLAELNNYDITIIDIPDEDWVRRSLDSFKPMKFGKKLWVCPSWQAPPDPNAINLTLDPGLAFGTGSHPTTSLCLEWLEENIPSEQQVIDYGCGSGILGIAALKLGAKKVFAVDNDPQALESATQNSQQNGFHPTVFTTFLPEDLPTTDIKADLVIANILAAPLIELAPKLASLTILGGKILLSGILYDQVESINNAYKNWYIMQHPISKGEWVSLVGIRANSI